MTCKGASLPRAFIRSCRLRSRPVALRQLRCASSDAAGLDPSITDPGMNGGYVNPPPMKRALRDPYGPWWDQQERRNFGEPVHEDNDILGVFSPEPYTHATPGKAGLHFGLVILAVLGFCGVVYQYYPDKPSVARNLPDDLEAELGGPGAPSAKTEEVPQEG